VVLGGSRFVVVLVWGVVAGGGAAVIVETRDGWGGVTRVAEAWEADEEEDGK
jgi:hypothetical protein